MLTRCLCPFFRAVLLPTLMLSSALADQNDSDKGKEVVGKIKASLYLGSDSALEKWAEKYAPVEKEVTGRLRGIKQMRFQHYSYENWLTPLKPSEEILLSFESRGRSDDGGLRLDLEFWQHRRKIMQMNPVLHADKPLLILGPRWRGCSLIIAIELID
ncbi:MAG: hypothetical protein GWP68_04625 [Verrucomicrobiaceae bacterium]|nr:hypothetical protein [Verrucomicrobiaceae bacterium]